MAACLARSGFLFLAAVFLMAIGAASSAAQTAVKQVLVLQSFDRGNLVLDHFTGNFRVSLDQRAGKPVNVVQVVVGPTGFVGAPEQAVVDYIRSIFADRPPPDLIMTVGGPAAAFARKHRQQLFPGTPLLFASVDQRWLRGAPLGENETAVAVANDFPRLVDDILRVLPETRQVFMVIGSGALGQFWRRELETEFARFRDRVTFVWSDELSLPEILRRVREPSKPLGDLLSHLRHGRAGRGVRGRAGARRPSRHGECPHVWSAEPTARTWNCRWVDDVHWRPCSQHGRRGQSNPEWRATWKPQSTATDRRVNRYSIGASCSGGASPRVGCRLAASCRFRGPSLWDEYRAHGSDRGWRAGFPIAPDRVAPVRAPRTAARRDREPAESGSRRRRQSPRDDVGADYFDRA